MVLFVDKAAVLGAGIMGARIAEVMAMNNVNVVVRDISDEFLAKGKAIVEQDLDELVAFHAGKAGKAIADFERKTGVALTDEQKATATSTLKPTYDAERKQRIMAKITWTTDLADVAACDFVVEAVPENLELKGKVLGELFEHLNDHAVVATNTSTISISELAAKLPAERRGKFLGVHFFNPPTQLPLIEIIPGIETRHDVPEDVIGVFAPMRNQRFPMMPIEVKECPGFLVNRILAPMLNEAFLCYEEGIGKPKDIDLAMQAGAGMPMGPLALADLVGLDVIQHAGESIAAQAGGRLPQRAPRIIKQLVAAGRLGKKSGHGFYEYKE
jgi:3-hydroxybutyryl-CoA dehydrogenase